MPKWLFWGRFENRWKHHNLPFLPKIWMWQYLPNLLSIKWSAQVQNLQVLGFQKTGFKFHLPQSKYCWCKVCWFLRIRIHRTKFWHGRRAEDVRLVQYEMQNLSPTTWWKHLSFLLGFCLKRIQIFPEKYRWDHGWRMFVWMSSFKISCWKRLCLLWLSRKLWVLFWRFR